MSVIHFLNVKEGDCSIIQHDSGHVSVVDICNGNASDNKYSDGRTVTAAGSWGLESDVKGNFNQKEHPEDPIAYMQDLGINEIFRFILTHPDMDHMDGIESLFGTFKVLNFWDTANNKSIEDNWGNGKYKKEDWDFYQKIRKSSSNPKVLHYLSRSQGRFYNLNEDRTSGGDGLYVLSPTWKLVEDANTNNDYNNLSYVILMKKHDKKIIFAGDSEKTAWNSILKEHGDEVSNIDILIAPHHGRKTGGSDGYLNVLNPKLSLLGNAKCKDLDYAAWNNQGLKHFTNNQGGNFILDVRDDEIDVYCSNKNFARACNRNTFLDLDKFNAWHIETIKGE